MGTAQDGLEGPFYNINSNLLVLSFSAYLNEQGEFFGGAVGYGPGVGAGTSSTYTRLYPHSPSTSGCQ
jgi:hypothetical protein